MRGGEEQAQDGGSRYPRRATRPTGTGSISPSCGSIIMQNSIPPASNSQVQRKSQYRDSTQHIPA